MNTTKTLLLVCMFAAWVTVPAMSQSETKQKKVNISVINHLYKGNSFFKADTKRPLYAQQSWALNLPERGKNCNAVKLQAELIRVFFNGKYASLDALLSDLKNNFHGDGTWHKVAKLGVSETEIDDDSEYNRFPQSTEYSIEYVKTGRNDISAYLLTTINDIGSGVGMGILWYKQYIMYDLKKGRIIKFEDIFKPGTEDAITKLLKKKAINLNDYKTLTSNPLPQINTDNFFIDYGNKTVSFVYDKYEVAAGCDGIVILKVTFDTLRPFMKHL